jgi:hypothetical protein
MKITLGKLKQIIREVTAGVPTRQDNTAVNTAYISGTDISYPAETGKLSPQDKDALEAQIRGLNSQRQIALNKKDAVTANELAINIAKVEKMLNA